MPNAIRGYGLAVLALLFATLVRWLLDPYLNLFVPFPSYFVAVALVGLYGGLGPAVFTMIAGGLIADYLFMPMRGSELMSDQEHWVSLGFFYASAAVLIAMAEWLRSSKVQLASAMATAERELAQRDQAEAAVRGSQARLQAIIDNSPLVLYIKDTDGRYLLANRSYLELFHTTAAQLLGITDHDRFAKEVADPLRNNDLEVIRSGRAQEFEESADIDGEHRTYTSTKFPLHDDTGRIYAVCGISLDITDRKRQQEELLEIDRRKDQFLSMLAHELRNPLAPIVTAAEFLRSAATDAAKQQRAIEVIVRQARHLTHLVDDLLDIARINTGRIQLRRDAVELAPLVRQAVDDARSRFAGREVALELAEPLPALLILADEARIRQVIDNLLDNAAKYTDPGGRVRVALEQNGDACVLSVSDTGVGIESRHLERVFHLFEQADATLDRSAGGLGLGLNLVKRIVEMHGGQVQARSEGLGRGSEFVVRLPLAERRTRRGTQPSPLDHATDSRRILVIEDNADAAESMEMLLVALGHTVQLAADGPSGLALAATFQPHTVLLDLGLPEMDGYQVARELRQRFGKDLRLVAVTGYGQEEYRQRSRAAGFDEHLVKPVAIDALVQALADVQESTAS